MTGRCMICEREETLTRHHLIPRTRHANKRNKREFDRAVVKVTVGMCRPCHSQLHALLTEKELEREWNSVEKLRSHPELRKFAAWIARKPRGFKPIVRQSGR
jgi:5-methylcytosine-specific restriction endonuclease McrA